MFPVFSVSFCYWTAGGSMSLRHHLNRRSLTIRSVQGNYHFVDGCLVRGWTVLFIYIVEFFLREFTTFHARVDDMNNDAESRDTSASCRGNVIHSLRLLNIHSHGTSSIIRRYFLWHTAPKRDTVSRMSSTDRC